MYERTYLVTVYRLVNTLGPERSVYSLCDVAFNRGASAQLSLSDPASLHLSGSQ